MKHTDKQIEDIALKKMKDIEIDYDKEIGIGKIRFYQGYELLRGLNTDIPIAAWVTSFEAGKWLFGENRPVFLTISDETGEPLYLQNCHAVIEITRDPNGKYFKKEL